MNTTQKRVETHTFTAPLPLTYTYVVLAVNKRILFISLILVIDQLIWILHHGLTTGQQFIS